MVAAYRCWHQELSKVKSLKVSLKYMTLSYSLPYSHFGVKWVYDSELLFTLLLFRSKVSLRLWVTPRNSNPYIFIPVLRETQTRYRLLCFVLFIISNHHRKLLQFSRQYRLLKALQRSLAKGLLRLWVLVDITTSSCSDSSSWVLTMALYPGYK